MRAIWGAVWLMLFRPSPKVLHGWRRSLLRLFGARVGRGAVVHPSVRLWAPWNLTMGDNSCLAPFVDCYSVAPITLGEYAAVSQYSFLCAATHDYSSLDRPLMAAPITIDAHAWVCADVFVGPGVRIGEGAVVGARSSVYRNVQPWAVVAGNPARFIKDRRPAQTGLG
jgi:putative colanic acid biosynthesis acetyltransferase WcaF